MNDYHIMLKGQRQYFALGETKDVDYRIGQLQKLYQWINDHEKDIMDALKEDLNKSPFEAYATEIGIVKEEISFTVKHLHKWAKTRYVKTPVTQWPGRSFIYQEPYGVVLIMSPWNYPFQLTIAPLVGALSAGNCAVIKPSAYSPATSALIKRMIGELFSSRYVAVVEGGRRENEALLDEQFDYIFFTGSVNVGKIVMEKAAKNLTPVSLELGGKSPCIVDETANVKLAAKRIVWGKFLNAGQTCVAPDYVLVHEEVKENLVKYMGKYISKMYSENPLGCVYYPKMIHEKHLNRVKGLIEGQDIAVGGKSNDASHQIEPTILDHVKWTDPVMQEEIFGPVLPILTFKKLRDVVQLVNAGPKPLALYFFTGRAQREGYVLKHISYGGGCINDVVVHLATSHMPFGGVGTSGMGSYHGKNSFTTFSHEKSIMKKATWMDVPVRYAPFRDSALKLLRKLQK